jgi:hypothetical protein
MMVAIVQRLEHWVVVPEMRVRFPLATQTVSYLNRLLLVGKDNDNSLAGLLTWHNGLLYFWGGLLCLNYAGFF